jgi:hypothetical protein
VHERDSSLRAFFRGVRTPPVKELGSWSSAAFFALLLTIERHPARSHALEIVGTGPGPDVALPISRADSSPGEDLMVRQSTRSIRFVLAGLCGLLASPSALAATRVPELSAKVPALVRALARDNAGTFEAVISEKPEALRRAEREHGIEVRLPLLGELRGEEPDIILKHVGDTRFWTTVNVMQKHGEGWHAASLTYLGAAPSSPEHRLQAPGFAADGPVSKVFLTRGHAKVHVWDDRNLKHFGEVRVTRGKLSAELAKVVPLRGAGRR